jgi:type III restriction enzyme
MIENILAGYQLLCRDYILQSIERNSKSLVVKSPTGSGKTVILISVIDKYLVSKKDTVFIWLTPGSGDLEEQSKDNMEEKSPHLVTKDLSETLTSGFEAGDTVFINWERVTKKGNKALDDFERKNLFDRIAQAHRNQIKFIIIIDEEHNNDTTKAQKIIDAFSAHKQIRVSATAKERPGFDFYQIEEKEVIKAGFITKAIIINEGIRSLKITDSNETETLLELGINKLREIKSGYDSISKNINPLLVVQFPSASEKLIEQVENFLLSKGFSYENGLLAKWMADEKDKINLVNNGTNIKNNNALPSILLMKQAISTGWDAPRAKILVKLRENMDEDFEIQTIGRIRRMPERVHYELDLLDCCYLFTLDSKYVESVRQSTENVFEIKKVKLKEKCKDFTLVKELKNSTTGFVNPKKVFDSILNHFQDYYKTTLNREENKKILSKTGYIIKEKIISTAKEGRFGTLADVKEDELNEINFEYSVDTSKYGYKLLNTVNHISDSIQIDFNTMSTILRRLFRKDFFSGKSVLNLDKKNYYAFIINNEEKLKEDLKKANSALVKQYQLHLSPVTKTFTIPEQELIKFDPYSRANDLIQSNAYHEYTEQTLVDGLRSKSEKLFERYCEQNPIIDWVYKNGDSGMQYFSIVYLNAFGRQLSFYPDYILKLKNGKIWIIETKGGQNNDGSTKNIDLNVKNKFESFKDYATKRSIKWAFIRDLNDKLYFNNTIYEESLDNPEVWKSIKDLFV